MQVSSFKSGFFILFLIIFYRFKIEIFCSADVDLDRLEALKI
jgi:hypothetical protein